MPEPKSLADLISFHRRLVEFQPVAGTIWCSQDAAHRFRHRCQDRAAARHVFQDFAMRRGGQQVQVELWRDMAAQREPVRLGERCGCLAPKG